MNPEENEEDVMGSAHCDDDHETAPMGSASVDVPGALTHTKDCNHGHETDER